MASVPEIAAPAGGPPPYAELQVTSNFSFLRGASHPEELVVAAASLGHRAIALTDRNSLAGVVRAHAAAKSHGIRFLPGARLVFRDAPDLLCLPTDRAAYARLCRLLTLGKRRAEKGACDLAFADFLDHAAGQAVLALLPEEGGADACGTEMAEHQRCSLQEQGHVRSRAEMRRHLFVSFFSRVPHGRFWPCSPYCRPLCLGLS